MSDGYIRFQRGLSSPNEVFDSAGEPFSHYRPVLEEMGRMGPGEWRRRIHRAHRERLEQQRELGMVPDDEVHPTDYVPRILPAADWAVLERGLAQRMLAINEWLRRLEAGKDEVVPEEVVESGTLFDASIPTRFGDVPNRQMGFDIVAVERSGRTGGWEYLVIEDNAKMPVGIEPMYILRARTPDVLPESYTALGANLAERHEVEVDRDGRLVHKKSGRRIDIIYERIEDGRIYDDVKGLIESQARGLIDAVFAPNLGVADDKGVYPFIPEMIRTYLGEEPVLNNVETYSLAVEDARRYVMDHFDELVIKSRSGWGGKDVLISPEESREDIEEFRRMVEENPVEYVAQEVIDFSTHVLCETDEANDGFVLRDAHADYRIHALAPDAQTIEVIPGAMTRVAAPGSKLVNISSGGKMKDTWVQRGA